MSYSVKVKLDDSGFRRIKGNLSKLSGQHKVSETELFPDSFVSANTQFLTLHALKQASGAHTIEDTQTEQFSDFIAEHTRFSNWPEMLKAAYVEYASRVMNS
jgi:hypothetical protein